MKNTNINFRLPAELKGFISEYANKHKWSMSFAICEILNQFFSKENRVS